MQNEPENWCHSARKSYISLWGRHSCLPPAFSRRSSCHPIRRTKNCKTNLRICYKRYHNHMHIDLRSLEAWFVTGSQHLYGRDTLIKVEEHSREIARGLSDAQNIPVQIVCKPVMTTPESIYELCLNANSAKNCIGLITWMHTFSP